MDVRVSGLAWLKKADLTYDQLRNLKRMLTAYPKKVGDYGDEDPKPIYLYREKDTEIGVARAFFQEHRRPVHNVTWDLTEGRKDWWPGEFKFHGTLRPKQQKGIDEVLLRFRAGSLGGLVRAVPGWGKTVFACALAAELQVPVLVVVHRDFLMNQWRKRIAEFLPDAQVGIVQQSSCEYRGKHIAIGMVHSLASAAYPSEFYEWPGLVVVDEGHRIGARTWSEVPEKFNARWRLALTATPKRKDGVDEVLNYHIGPLIYATSETRMKPTIKRVWTDFRLIKTDSFNPNLAKKGLILRFLTASAVRNRLIVDQMVRAAQAGRKLLVLSERVKHLQVMEAMFRQMWPKEYGEVPSTDFYVGGRTEAQYEKAEKARVIFATAQYAKEALDIPPLDTLFLTTPLSDVEQAVGRILRPFDGKKAPIVVDIRDDNVPVCKRNGESRDRYYSKVT